MSGRFLAVGECMVELSPAAGGLFRRGFAGDTFNTAWYARGLLPPEWEVGYATCIGTDAASDEMAAFIASQGIDVSALRRVPDRTIGLYMISTEAGERSFSYWRGQSAARCLARDADWLAATLAGRDLIHFSGITVAILPPDDRRALCDALSVARKAGAKIAFDTNIRPRLWEDVQTMRQGLMLGAGVADIVLPSFDEETGVFGDRTPADTVARYRDAGAGVVVVKNGAQPLVGHAPETGAFTHSPPAVSDVVDTTAARDSFAAGLLASLAAGHGIDRALDVATTLAGRIIRAPGALVPGSFTGLSAGRQGMPLC